MTTDQKQRRRAPRLTTEDWTNRAKELLIAEGVQAVKINRLCADLKVTKGSFYWHFADIDELMTSIAESWIAETKAVLAQLGELHALPPLEQVRAMALRLVDERNGEMERSLREWARTDARIAAMIAEADTFIFTTVQSALEEAGLAHADARVRAGLLVYAGIGFASGQSALPTPTVEEIDGLVRMLAAEISS